MKNEWRLVGASALLAAVSLTAACGGAPRDETPPSAGLEGAATPGVPAGDTATRTSSDPIDQSTGGIQPAPSGSGAISGRIHLVGPSPGNPIIRMGADPLCSRLNRGKRVVQETVVASADGGLANVFITLDGSFPASAAPGSPITLNQEGCVYYPRVVGVRAGQALEVRNADALMHNVHGVSAADNGFNVSQPRDGMVQTFQMANEERMLRMRCDVHNWMTAYVGVVSHPYFAVSGTDGAFDMVGVPPGTYTVRIWHERFGELTQTVRVSTGETATIDFEFTGTETPPSAGVRDLLVPAAAVHVARTS
ncbi:MAG: carboxypeptidase regulatory-like domain-containing protein [Acidobacteria bacterium]|nr:carboxypeptidase regulatory-like domain-containing protein [Acidobacteriota bacterium]